MKTKLLPTNKQPYTLYWVLVFCLCVNYGFSQNLMLNPTCDEWTTNTTDNADAYDMTPNNTIVDNTGTTVPSPYQAIWDNDPLEDWLEVFYLGMAGTLDEQPGSTSGGNNGTRGVKLYMDTSPSLPGQSSRRIYQKVEGLTPGNDYIFSVESRSEAMNTPSEVYILNTQIADEVGINANGGGDSSVDGYADITTDFDNWTTSTINFTATNNFVVVYIRSLSSVDGTTEVFYDNFSLVEDTGLSVEEELASHFKAYPNPAKNVINIASKNQEITSINMFDILGKEVQGIEKSKDNVLDVSALSAGIYLLKINSKEKSITKKIIIE